MPVQKFTPMVKEFPTFDCDAHVTEPPWLWDRAKDYLTTEEYESLKASMWFDPESKQLVVNGHPETGLGSQRVHGTRISLATLGTGAPPGTHGVRRSPWPRPWRWARSPARLGRHSPTAHPR